MEIDAEAECISFSFLYSFNSFNTHYICWQRVEQDNQSHVCTNSSQSRNLYRKI